MYSLYDDPAVIRNALLDLVPAIARKYRNVGSVAAAQWYEQMRAKWIKEDYTVDSTYDPDDVPMRQTVRRLAGNLWDKDDGTPADPDAMLRGLHAGMDRWVKAGGRETIERVTRHDPSKPRYARVPQGAKTCAFCSMVASRGFVYSSAEAAGGDMNKYHHDCDCEIIPSWDKNNPKIEGYDPEKLYQKYLKAWESLGKENPTLEEILEAMRRMGGYTDSIDTDSSPKLDKLKTLEPRQHLKEITHSEVNPQWDEWIESKLQSGIQFEDLPDNPWGINCQRVVMAMELRLRGYDVCAVGNLDKNDDGFDWLIADLWKTADGKHRRFTQFYSNSKTQNAMLEYPVGSRFFVAGEWEKGGGHIWNAEITQTEDGSKTLRMYDVQTGDLASILAKYGQTPRKYGDPNKYVERLKEGTFEFLRVDDIQPINVILGKGEYDFESGRQRIAKPWVISVKNAKEYTESKLNAIEWQEENQQDHFQEYLDWDDSTTSQGSNNESS
ncbi:phage protein [Bifidobacterium hapali]|uniref:Phage protein n=1 Tax=Bifidobacterium hapali TaxID=1630172 RepID=A0A261FY74_9BIFI|nr:toxin glutamine deamidase domain-containing protein [Bifidobacterium hapali]OZG64144.1 phage protein [Bifidobacterium hapali]